MFGLSRHRIRFELAWEASLSSPQKEKQGIVAKTMLLRRVPPAGENITLDFAGTRTISEVNTVVIRGGTMGFWQELFIIRLSGTLLPYESDYLVKSYGWKRLSR